MESTVIMVKKMEATIIMDKTMEATIIMEIKMESTMIPDKKLENPNPGSAQKGNVSTMYAGLDCQMVVITSP